MISALGVARAYQGVATKHSAAVLSILLSANYWLLSQLINWLVFFGRPAYISCLVQHAYAAAGTGQCLLWQLRGPPRGEPKGGQFNMCPVRVAIM